MEALASAVAPQFGCGTQFGCADPATALPCLRRVPVQKLFSQAQLFQAYAFGNSILTEIPTHAGRLPRRGVPPPVP